MTRPSEQDMATARDLCQRGWVTHVDGDMGVAIVAHALANARNESAAELARVTAERDEARRTLAAVMAVVRKELAKQDVLERAARTRGLDPIAERLGCAAAALRCLLTELEEGVAGGALEGLLAKAREEERANANREIGAFLRSFEATSYNLTESDFADAIEGDTYREIGCAHLTPSTTPPKEPTK